MDIQYQVMLDNENEERSSHVIGYKNIIQVEEVEKKRRGLLKPSRILAELLETNSPVLRIDWAMKDYKIFMKNNRGN